MKWITRLVLLVVLSASVVACAAPPELSERYSGTLAGIPISLAYATGWEVFEMSDTTMAIAYGENTGMTIASGRPFVPSKENMDVMLYSYFNQYAVSIGDLAIVSGPEDSRIGGVAAREMVLEGTDWDGEASVPTRLWLIVGGDEGVDFSIVARTPAMNWQSAEPFFRAMLDSIEFSQPDA